MSPHTQTTTSEQPQPWIPPWQAAKEWALHEGTVVAMLVLALIWRNWIRPHLMHSRIRLRYSVAQDLEIKSVLSQVMELMQADRVLICEFHNGEQMASNRHWIKLTATQEDVQPGIERIASQVRGIPQSRLAQELAAIEDGNLHTFHRDYQVPEGCRAHMINIGAYVVREQLLLSRGEALGILVIHYCRDLCCRLLEKDCFRALELTEEQKRRYEELYIRLCGLMRNRSDLVDRLRSLIKSE